MPQRAGLTLETAEELSRRLKEPSWLTQMRAEALQRHEQLPWPHPSDDIWRRTDVSVFDPHREVQLPSDGGLLRSAKVDERLLGQVLEPAGSESLSVRVDGEWLRRQVPHEVVITDVADAAPGQAEMIRRAIEADGLTPSEQKLTTLNAAFHHDTILAKVPAGFSSPDPIRLVRVLSVAANVALFPLTVLLVGSGSSVTLIQEDVGVSASASDVPHVLNGRIEVIVEPHAKLQYCRIQRWHAGAHEFLLQRATVHEGAQLTMVNIHIGGQVSKSHVIAKLLGRHATSKVFGFLFGHGRQHLDYHSLQDHQAPQTMSDLLYKAALKDQSRMIYTGLIRIAKAAKQTDAFQTNHNLLLGAEAKAETIPMLEILADDVRCKHAATIGPVDEEQLFYLMSRGLPRDLAERLLVMGFVEPVLEQVPSESLRERLREELEGTLGAGA